MNFITFTNLGNWNYYIFSDDNAMWSALNGLAAWFNSSSGILNSAALLGSLIVLSVALFSLATHSIKINAKVIATWLFFAACVGLKGTAVVTNAYTQQVMQISNVPAIVLVPASIFSTSAWTVFQGMDASFQSPVGSYMSVKQNGFAGPLEVLLALRSPAVSPIDPYLKRTLESAIKDCTLQPNRQAPGNVPFEKSLDMLNWLTMYGRQTGLTNIYTVAVPDGYASSCGGAFAYLDTNFASFVASKPMANLINQSVKVKNPNAANGQWDATQLTNSWDLLIGSTLSVQQNAYQFAKNALIASTVTYSLECLGESNGIISPANCTTASLIQGEQLEAWKTNAAMSGSGFLKTMFTSIGFLQVLFFSLFPIIAIYALVVAENTGKVFGGYIFFGIWTQSWMLVIAPIQAYIQNNVLDSMRQMLVPSGGLTLANSNAIYTMLSTKLAIASDTMASSQMLSLALLSGSMFALNSVAQRWSGEQHVDSTKLQPELVKNSPVSTVSGQQGKALFGTGKSGGGNVLTGGSYLDAFSGSTSFVDNVTNASTSTKSLTNSQGHNVDIGRGVSESTSMSFTSAEMAQMQKAYETYISGTAGISGAIAGDILKGIGKARNVTFGKEEAARGEAVIQKAQSQAAANLTAKDASFISKLTSSDSNVKAEAWGQVASHAIDLLTVGALAAELVAAIPTGGGTAALAPETLLAGAALRTTAKEGVKAYVKRNAATGMTGAASEAAIADKKGFFSAIAGNTNSGADAAVKQSAQDSETWKADKSRSSDAKWDSSMQEKVSTGVQKAQQKAYSESASKGVTNTTSMDMNTESLVRMAAKGNGTYGAEDLRQKVHAGAELAKIQNPGAVAHAETMIKQNLAERTVTGGEGANETQIRDFMHDVMLQHILNGGKVMLNGAMAPSGGPPAGQSVTGGPREVVIPAQPAKPAHFEPIKPTPAGSTPPRPATWWRTDKLSDIEAAKAAGFRLVPATPATPASTKTVGDPSEAFNTPDITNAGNYNLNVSGDQNRKNGNEAIDKLIKESEDAKAALANTQKRGVETVTEQQKRDEATLAAGAFVNVAASVVSGLSGYDPKTGTTFADKSPTPVGGDGKPATPVGGDGTNNRKVSKKRFGK